MAFFAENEKLQEVKLHILLAGVSVQKYWLGNIVFDYANFVVICVIAGVIYSL